MNQTPNITDNTDKVLKSDETSTQKVDINVLKARAKAIKDKESLTNNIFIGSIILVLVGLGIFFSI